MRKAEKNRGALQPMTRLIEGKSGLSDVLYQVESEAIAQVA